jgi:hypothetical protein
MRRERVYSLTLIPALRITVAHCGVSAWMTFASEWSAA